MVDQDSQPRRFRFIGCEVLFRELCLLAAAARHVVDLEFVRKGLHSLPSHLMRHELQRRIDQVDASVYEAVLLGYGRCSNGTVGLQARSLPLVIPRAHDCITLFLGSKQRYQRYFEAHPGTYFRTSGWIERDFAAGDRSVKHLLGLDRSRQEYVRQYGQDNADFIMQIIDSWKSRYNRLVFIDTGVAWRSDYEQRTRREAAERGWQFQTVAGDLGLLARMLDGQWDPASFVVVPPGHQVAACNDERILVCEPA